MSLLKKSRIGRGFTIVELLVVIVITALLITLVLPALQQSRETANLAICKSDERQLGVAFAAYNSDWKQAYPYADPAQTPVATGTYKNWPGATDNPWMAALGPYLGFQVGAPGASVPIVKVLRCPDNPWAPYWADYQDVPATTYGMGTIFPKSYSDTSNFSVDPYLNSAYFYQPANQEKIIRPWKVCLLGEVPNMQASDNAWNTAYFDDQIDYVVLTAGLEWNPTQNALWAYSNPWGGNIGRRVRVNHANTSWNSLACDGSVTNITKTTLFQYAYDADQKTPGSDGLMYFFNRTR